MAWQPQQAWAQLEPTPGSVAADYFRQGESAMLNRQYKQAIRHFERALNQQPSLTIAEKMIGHCYDLLKDYPRAAEQFVRVLARDSLFSRALYYQLAEIYYKMGRGEVALHYFQSFERLQARPPADFGLRGIDEQAEELVYLDRLPGNIRACELTIDSVKFINITEIENLGGSVNTKSDDYFPCLTNNQDRLYFTRKDREGDEDLFTSERYEGSRWGASEKVRSFNTSQPEGMITLVRDGRQVFFTSCLRDGVGGPCDIWEALNTGPEIRNMRSLGAPINDLSWESQAAISCDGSTIFFASNREGGVGGSDIWTSSRQANGLWSTPVNLGISVNTPADEEAPFISNDGQTLYFSSTGHLGLGEQDIFMSWWDQRMQRWSVPINLGPPVNGPHRELGFFLSADGKTGYFASDRPGGFGGMDIYHFALSDKLYGEPITFVEGFVKDSVLLTPIPGVPVHINGRNPLKADEQGRFFICAGADETLDFSATQDTYHPYHHQFLIPRWDNRQFYTIELLMRPTLSFITDLNEPTQTPPPAPKRAESVLTHAVYFDFDSDDLLAREIQGLEKLIDSLRNTTIMHVEIIGYADDIGADNYNLSLSEERAKVVAIFLLERNILINQVHIEGRGPVREEGPKAKNRRVDIRVTVRQE